MTAQLREANVVTRGHIGRGLPLYPDEPTTLPDLFRYAAAKFNKPDALNFKKNGEWRHISSSAMIERAENIACGLNALGLVCGDRVAILAANSQKWTLTDAGSQFAGIIDVPIYTTLSPNLVQFILNDSESKVLFLEDTASLERLRGVINSCPALCRVVIFERDSNEAFPIGPEVMSLEELESLGADLRGRNTSGPGNTLGTIQPEDIATLIYTSGTTGEPKGVMLSHSNIISNTIDAGENYDFSVQDISLSVLPLSHIFERTAMYLYILNGMSVYYAESIERIPENLQEVRPTIFIGVPRIFEKVYAKAKLNASIAGGAKEKIFDWAVTLAKEYSLTRESGGTIPASLKIRHTIADRLVYAKLRQFFGGRLKFCITGGAALADEIYLIFTGAGISIMQGYGLTETSPVISSNRPGSVRLGTVGKPIRNVKVRIAQDGEVEVRSPGVMAGYYRNKQATDEVFTDDGWFRTGDIGSLDGDGFLIITDRKKELFKTSGGKYIAPTPIEQMLRSSKFVNQAVLIGNNRKFAAALIVPNFDMLRSYAQRKGLKLSTPSELCQDRHVIDLFARQIEHVTQGLSQFETVKKFALLENELTVDGGELTPTMKVKRREVEQKYKDVIEEMYK